MSQKYPGRSGSKKLVLSQIGGGVFRNPSEIILNAIASCQDLIVKSGLEVYLVCYSESSFEPALERLQPMMEATGGRVITS
jgi:hypothetical protein